MASPAHSRNPSEGVRSRRSYPSFQHISLAPLSTKFPVDDYSTDTDYFTAKNGEAYTPTHAITSSYLASLSVPATPGVLSDSRSVSYMHLPRRKKTTTTGTPSPASDTHLDELNTPGPLHHHRNHHQRGTKSHSSRPKAAETPDNEWLMRAGLALASSAREEKGQSWLVKRESSTSLVSDIRDERVHYSERSHRATRRPRSGVATPLVLSRRPSSSHSASRHASRLDLRMTARKANDEPHPPRDEENVVPDFVDESIRAQMAALVTGGRDESDIAHDSRRCSTFALSVSSDLESNSDFETEDEVDEAEMQRITRQRGFGLGSWIDSLVEWTLFGVEDDLSTGPVEPPAQAHRGDFAPHEELAKENIEIDTDGSETEMEDHDFWNPSPVEPAGTKGGWADVRWLLRVAKQAL
ncbi:hypothetical protein VTO42DRAFT_8771 [Malbranchea cinnamomea]